MLHKEERDAKTLFQRDIHINSTSLSVLHSHFGFRYEMGVSKVNKILDSLLWVLIVGGIVGFIALIAVGGLTYFNF